MSKNSELFFKCFTGCSVQIDAGISTYPVSEMQTGDISPVDKESYRPSDVTTRSQLLSPSGSPVAGIYDFNDGVDNDRGHDNDDTLHCGQCGRRQKLRDGCHFSVCGRRRFRQRRSRFCLRNGDRCDADRCH